ncbi:S8 family peptidase [Paeniglutamicibacter sulfureus]|uniref:Subtilisin family serine protease n=1 Tax=Paeniglutamicibacter sulfureus TaxID=43666 RepID=A0ABU2BEZ4_9MICC|nr:S8 family serine peptidase [Paeniglutamicibacter sulfureus]MDO2936506.1 S8 family serine peptidase [Paeniglutamicibacter sulfureus]MDR7356846.1 subtilisin family serine protease [Paeniglutamicibacter sulfureus]
MFISDESPTANAATPVPGRYVVVFADPHPSAGERFGARTLQEEVPTMLEREGFSLDTYFPRLGVAVVGGESAQLGELQARCDSRNMPLRIVPELMYHILSSPAPEPGIAAGPPFADNDELTWGLQAVRARESGYTGRGIRVAVLDTGFDAAHPDFAGRDVTTMSFIEGEDSHDGHGHGTHCIGTACGPRPLPGARAYGVAPEASIFAGKVLSNEGSGSDTGILAGIDWALQNDCHIISMSLGADVREVHPPYVAAGHRALERGTLIVAAAGNNARRSAGNPGFVGAPANSPYILSVAALDENLLVADFSARTLPGRGGQVDVSGPGVKVYSSWPGAQRYNTISGTSMATPHVAGVAALLSEATGYRGRELWAELVQESERLEQFSVDVGAGLAQAPPPIREQASAPVPEPVSEPVSSEPSEDDASESFYGHG